MKRLIVLCFVATLIVTGSALASEITTGNKLLEWAERPDDFAKGFFTGYASGVSICSSSEWCLPEGVTYGQTREVVLKYLKDHPEELHLNAADLVAQALRKAWPCK